MDRYDSAQSALTRHRAEEYTARLANRRTRADALGDKTEPRSRDQSREGLVFMYGSFVYVRSENKATNVIFRTGYP